MRDDELFAFLSQWNVKPPSNMAERLAHHITAMPQHIPIWQRLLNYCSTIRLELTYQGAAFATMIILGILAGSWQSGTLEGINDDQDMITLEDGTWMEEI